MECKNVCSSHKDIFVNKNKTLLLGIDVYFCKACNIFIKFKEILTNFVNTIFHKQLKKYRCACCSTKLRVKSQRKKTKDNKLKIRCGCGCGELINKVGVRGTPVKYKHNHHTRRDQEIAERTCLFCNSNKTELNKNENKTPRWFKYEHGYLCKSCYGKLKYREKKIKNLKKISYLEMQL